MVLHRQLRTALLVSAIVVPLQVLPARALGDDNIVYVYDALGRLVGATVSGATNHGTQTSIGYDPAGNRIGYQVAGTKAVPAAVSTPVPTPAPTPSNAPPSSGWAARRTGS